MRDLATEKTIQLDKAQGVSEPASAAARFQTASGDGSRVFFTDDQALVAGASVEPAQGNHRPVRVRNGRNRRQN